MELRLGLWLEVIFFFVVRFLLVLVLVLGLGLGFLVFEPVYVFHYVTLFEMTAHIRGLSQTTPVF